MELLRKLRWVLYPSVFIIVFFFAAYFTFPNDVVKKFVDNAVFNAALIAGPRDRGFPIITMKDVSLWRISGVSVDGLKVSWAAGTKSLPLALNVDRLSARVGIFSLLTSKKQFSLKGDFYGGMLEAQVGVSKTSGLSNIALSLEKLELAKMDFLEAMIGSPLKGLLTIDTDVSAASQMSKDGSGVIKLVLDKAVFGPGNINLPPGGFVSSIAVPEIKLGKLNLDLALDKGQLTSKSVTLNGGDLEADVKLTVVLGRSIHNTRIDGNGWFSLKKEFVAANETFKMLFDLIPELRTAQQGDGKVPFSIRGALARPQFKLERAGAVGTKP